MSVSHTVTKNQLLQFLLRKQGLIERLSGEVDASIFPLHATSHTTPFISLLARYINFHEEGWKAFAAGGNTCFLSRCMRGTLHFVPYSLKPTLGALYQSNPTDEAEEEDSKKPPSSNRYDTSGLLEKYDIPEDEAQALSEEIVKAITKFGPQNTVSIKKLLPKKLIKKRELGGNVGIVMRRMLSLGRLEYGMGSTARITWRKKERLFSLPLSTSTGTVTTTTTTTTSTATATPIATTTASMPTSTTTLSLTTTTTLPSTTSTRAIVPVTPTAVHSYERALIELAFFYFERYGPAAVDDFIWWAGLSPLACKVAVKAIQTELVHVKVTGIVEDLFILRTQLDKLKASPNEAPQMVRLLPYEDALIKAYKATRYRFFGDKDEAIDQAMKHSITKCGEAKPTVWLDGTIIGIWS